MCLPANRKSKKNEDFVDETETRFFTETRDNDDEEIARWLPASASYLLEIEANDTIRMMLSTENSQIAPDNTVTPESHAMTVTINKISDLPPP
jgi:hypothetical protein